jgi:hypothetical protein
MKCERFNPNWIGFIKESDWFHCLGLLSSNAVSFDFYCYSCAFVERYYVWRLIFFSFSQKNSNYFRKILDRSLSHTVNLRPLTSEAWVCSRVSSYWICCGQNGAETDNYPSYSFFLSQYWESGSSGSIVSGYGLDERAIEVRSPAEAKRIFPLTSVSRPALGPT